ncbi:J domain-containing protein [Carboxylicivirga linearis]|uniref:J domain-containing protein n=1 Tax=Carboxylicivirga linearis TaxID=1628157 RepID=A0ABS5K1X1_9BACT|nr:hypothetical protein [Carboxylicivirga linearis]MBS2101095.1 hypothetical protein [Carboxylicivirga linearis]
MNYFLGINDIEQAKLRYRKLAKQLHPDKGGTAFDFQEMQAEYKEFLLRLQQEQKVVTPSRKNKSAENELINELGRLAKVLIKKQVPQEYLRQKMQTTDSPLKKGLFANIVNLLDSLQ